MNENSTNGSRVNRNQKLYDQHPSKKKIESHVKSVENGG